MGENRGYVAMSGKRIFNQKIRYRFCILECLYVLDIKYQKVSRKQCFNHNFPHYLYFYSFEFKK